MSPEPITLDPEVEDILRELASRPGSALLTVPRRMAERTVLERAALAHARSALLSAAERHLVSAHREQLAFVLRQAAYRKLNECEPTSLYAIDRADPRLAGHIPSSRTVRAAASDSLRRDRGHGEGVDALELLERCIATEPNGWVSVSQLAAASHRLVPTDAARIYVGADLVAAGSAVTAIGVYTEVARCPRDSDTGTAALCSLSFALRLAGRHEESLRAAVSAARRDPMNLMAQVNRMWRALELGNAQEAHEACARIDALLSTDPDRADALVAWTIAGRRSRGLAPAVIARSFTAAKLAALGPLAGRLIHGID